MKKKGINIYFLLFIIGVVVAIYYGNKTKKNDLLSTQEFYADVKTHKIVEINITPNSEVPTGVVKAELANGDTEKYYAADVKEVERYALENGVIVYMDDIPDEGIWSYVFIGAIVLVVFVIIFSALAGGGAGGGGQGARMMSFGKSRAQLVAESKYTFKDVAGLKEEKEQLEEIVDFLKTPVKYTSVGARIPKGVLLEGQPGTGKTLLAKAIAGEAKVPFFTISGSDFVEMFVGVGASRVRDLFSEAKKNAPCIVFIDEIDAVARKRGAGLGGSHDEREQTLNQLLVEMDGFGVNEGIIVMAATNRIDILDPAILRPGRFDRKITVSSPDVGGREEILKVHSKNKPLAEDVDLKEIARKTIGFTGADIENLLNESAILAAKDNRKFILDEDVKKSFIKVCIGTEKKSRVISDEDKKLTAYHEAGHALLYHLLPHIGPVYMVSVIPTGESAAGYTMPLPERDDMHMTKSRMLERIMAALGGRIAEEIIFGDISTGASSDIESATKTARLMVTKFGMSRLGTIKYESDEDEVFIGRDYGRTKTYSEKTAGQIDDEVRNIIDDCYAKAKQILEENRDKLDACADMLMEKERINREEFESIFA